MEYENWALHLKFLTPVYHKKPKNMFNSTDLVTQRRQLLKTKIYAIRS